MAEAKREVEIKFRVSDEQALRDRLATAGAQYQGKYYEENYFCDDPAGHLKASDRLLRLRRSTSADGPQATAVEHRLTYKEPVPDPRFKVRNEVEIIVSDLDGMRLVLERLGFQCRHGYDKEREMWQLWDVLVTLDTLSFGRFVELEGPPEAIDQVAVRLGFDPSQGITRSYLSLASEASG
jgi:adenylate cyclase class 2